jgi:stage IV sporulation protein B
MTHKIYFCQFNHREKLYHKKIINSTLKNRLFFHLLFFERGFKILQGDFLKAIRIIIKTIFFVLLIFNILVFSSLFYLNNSIDTSFKIKSGEALNIDAVIPITAEYNGGKLRDSSSYSVGEKFSVNLKAFGIIPISTAEVQVVDEMQVALLGQPFGMKIYTNGVLVSEISDVLTKNGLECPAKKAGLKIGDYIVSVDGEMVYTNEDLSRLVEKSAGNRMKLKVIRGKNTIHISLKAVKSKDSNQYKIGLWVKDSSAGIGTLTFYSPTYNIVCGLGHGVCDSESEKLLKIKSGEIVSAEIISVEKGGNGTPGQLKGRFNYKRLGDISLNCEQGIYSNFEGNLNFDNLTQIAFKREIKNGNAKILCTVNGENPKYYSCKIEVRKSNYNSKTQNMLITVTDKDLLEKTGGIVQGMSGSPILQNGKLIGAVTHVLLEDSTKGYAIFAENMLETAQNVNKLVLNEAS